MCFFFSLSTLPTCFLFDIFIISFHLSFKYPTCPEFSFSPLWSCPIPYLHSPSEVWFYYICLSSHFLDRSSWIKISSLFPLHQKKQEPPSAPASHLLYSVFMTDFPGTGRFRIRGSLRRLEEEKSYAKAETVSKCFGNMLFFLEINYKVSNRANQTTEEHRGACPCVFEKDICENSQSDVSPRELRFPHQLILRINIVERDQGFPARFSGFWKNLPVCDHIEDIIDQP